MIVLELLEKFNDFLSQSIAFRGFKFLLGVYLWIMVVAIGLMIYRLIKADYFTILQTGQEFPLVKGKMQERWEAVQKMLASSSLNNWQAAILETGNMLFEVLDTVGYQGENLTEKLDNLLDSQLDHLEELRQATQVRARIVQATDFQVSQEEARQTVEIFAEALRSMEAID